MQTRLLGEIIYVAADRSHCFIRASEKIYHANSIEFARPFYMVLRRKVEFTPSPAIRPGYEDEALNVEVKDINRSSVEAA